MLEIHLEVNDLDIAEKFYQALLPYQRISRWDDGSAVAFVLNDGTAFGLWKKGKLGLFGGQGAKHLHYAFQIEREEIDSFRNKLHNLGVDVIEHTWPSGDMSLYFFDPDGHQGEFMTKDWLKPFS
ncbi:MAG: hypothetical protein IPH75_14060 [bacterium]|nr:hypothetical protein [bacterium]